MKSDKSPSSVFARLARMHPAAWMMGLLIAAKALNFVKKIMIGKFYGVTFLADAFFSASYLPYHAAIYFEGIIFLLFLPLLAEIRQKQGPAESEKFSLFFGLVLLAGAALVSVLMALLAPWIIGELVPGFSADERGLIVELFRVMSFAVLLISLCTFFQAMNSFSGRRIFSSTSALTDAAVMIGVLTLTSGFGIQAAAWASLAGALTAFFCQMGAWLRGRHFRFATPSLDAQKKWLRRLGGLIIPMGFLWALQQCPFVILNRFASGMWAGTISALSIAQTMTSVPMALVNQTVLLAVLPLMARQAYGQSAGSAEKTFFQTLKSSFVLLVPAGITLSALSRPVSVLFFSGGGILPEGTARIANCLSFFGFSLFALYADLFTSQSLVSAGRVWPALVLAATRAVMTYAIGYGLSSLWDYRGLAFSYSAGLLGNFFLFAPWFLARFLNWRGWTALFKTVFRAAGASIPGLLVGFYAHHWTLREWMGFPASFTAFFLFAALALVVSSYAFLGRVFGLFDDLTGPGSGSKPGTTDNFPSCADYSVMAGDLA